MISCSVHELVQRLVHEGPAQDRKIFHVDMQGISVPVRVLDIPAGGAAGMPLVIVFHGGSNQNQPYPFFFGQRFRASGKDGERTVIALCDPTLSKSDTLRFGWFSGWFGVDVPSAITSLVTGLVQGIGSSRTIIVGGSIGAHAALRHALSVPESTVILANPLPQISTYYLPGVQDYFETCWPGEHNDDFLSPHVLDDASDLYDGCPLHSDVIVIQNATDPHLCGQAAQLLMKLGRHTPTRHRILPLMHFFPDQVGHSLPAELLPQWVDAAVRAPSTEVGTIAITQQVLSSASAEAPSKLSAGKPADHRNDEILARQLAVRARRAAA